MEDFGLDYDYYFTSESTNPFDDALKAPSFEPYEYPATYPDVNETKEGGLLDDHPASTGDDRGIGYGCTKAGDFVSSSEIGVTYSELSGSGMSFLGGVGKSESIPIGTIPSGTYPLSGGLPSGPEGSPPSSVTRNGNVAGCVSPSTFTGTGPTLPSQLMGGIVAPLGIGIGGGVGVGVGVGIGAGGGHLKDLKFPLSPTTQFDDSLFTDTPTCLSNNTLNCNINNVNNNINNNKNNNYDNGVDNVSKVTPIDPPYIILNGGGGGGRGGGGGGVGVGGVGGVASIDSPQQPIVQAHIRQYLNEHHCNNITTPKITDYDYLVGQDDIASSRVDVFDVSSRFMATPQWDLSVPQSQPLPNTPPSQSTSLALSSLSVLSLPPSLSGMDQQAPFNQEPKYGKELYSLHPQPAQTWTSTDLPAPVHLRPHSVQAAQSVPSVSVYPVPLQPQCFPLPLSTQTGPLQSKPELEVIQLPQPQLSQSTAQPQLVGIQQPPHPTHINKSEKINLKRKNPLYFKKNTEKGTKKKLNSYSPADCSAVLLHEAINFYL